MFWAKARVISLLLPQPKGVGLINFYVSDNLGFKPSQRYCQTKVFIKLQRPPQYINDFAQFHLLLFARHHIFQG